MTTTSTRPETTEAAAKSVSPAAAITVLALTAVLGLAALQLLTGLSNVVLDWPLLAALLHTGGAALLTTLMAALVARSHARQHRSAPRAVLDPQLIRT